MGLFVLKQYISHYDTDIVQSDSGIRAKFDLLLLKLSAVTGLNHHT